MIRLAIVDGLASMAVVRGGGWTLVLMPPLMAFDDALEWSRELYRPEEAAVFRAHYNVSAANDGEGWRDVLPSVVCPCHVPESLRLAPWPLCPLHDGGRGADVSVVEVAERMLRLA